MARIAHTDVRDKILCAARNRVLHYGYKKTTIDEIAMDAGIGKGTIYLYFESKEDVALAVMAEMKRESLCMLQSIAADKDLDPLEKLKRMLIFTPVTANERCVECPAAIELIIALKPHFTKRMQPFQDLEISLLTTVLREGVSQGLFRAMDTDSTARVLKAMVSGFLPPYPFVNGTQEISEQIKTIVELVFEGMRPTASDARNVCQAEVLTDGGAASSN